jgi:hypothetical protein
MIKNIYFDLDETLAFTSMLDPEQENFSFVLDGYRGTHYTIVRPCAKRVIDFARELVGAENVYILTIAVKPYALKINELAGWGFKEDQIFSREDIEIHRYSTAYGGYSTVSHKTADINNVLIDNLPLRENARKIDFIGLGKNHTSNYFKVHDYYGVNFPDDPFEENLKEFLIERHKSLPSCKDVCEEVEI